MAKMPLSEFEERMKVATVLLREAYPDNPAVEQVCEAITIGQEIIRHISIPFQNIVEDKLDIDN